MAINLTQELTFETDTLADFVTVLDAILPVRFPSIRKGLELLVEPGTSYYPSSDHPSEAAAVFLGHESGGLDAWFKRPDRRPLYYDVCRVRHGTSKPGLAETAMVRAAKSSTRSFVTSGTRTCERSGNGAGGAVQRR